MTREAPREVLAGVVSVCIGGWWESVGQVLARLFESRATIDDDCLPCEPATLSRVA